MQSQTLTPFELFGNQVRYTVPLFQRPYVWTREKQWEPLWEDVRTVAERILENRETQVPGGLATEAVPHFLGAIVLDQRSVPAAFIQERHIIDGQQRLITLQLMLDAAQAVVAEFGTNADAAALRKLVLNDADVARSPSDVFKVWPTNYDRLAFTAAMDDTATPGADVQSSRIVEAHRYFAESVNKWAEVDGDPDKVHLRLNSLTMALSQYLRMVVIDLEPGDNPQVIFETLNFRGTPLLAADLVKNLVFRRAEAEGIDVEQLYETAWRRFDSEDWRKQVRQGRLQRPRIDVFLNYWLAMRKAHEVPADRIFTDFSDYLRLSDAGLTEVVEDLNHHADVFDGIDQLQPYSVEGTFVYRVLNVLEQGALWPVLLWILGQDPKAVSPDQRRRALSSIENWLVRRMICRWTQQAVNRMMIDLLKLLSDGPSDVGDTVTNFLLERTGEAGAWPTDSDVLEALTTTPLYTAITRARLRMLLEALEDYRRSPKTEEKHCERRRLTIEHVMPRQWREHWPLPGVDPPELEAIRRDSLIHTLGNLTLVTGSLNPALSNRPWSDAASEARGLDVEGKRSILDSHSVLLLNHDVIVGHIDEWNEKDIEVRTLALADRIIELWPRPDGPALSSGVTAQAPVSEFEETTTSRHWLVTCNPNRWDIFGFLDDGHALSDIESWSVVQHLDELRVGDDVALWITGAARGVYAVGHVAGPIRLESGDDYWTDESDRSRQRKSLPVDFDLDLMDAPILSSDLEGDPRFSDASVITFPRGGNPHRLTNTQWSAIADRI